MKTEIEQKASFNIMRYAQCWEDADMLIQSLNINSNDVCLSIASAGENSFSLLSQSPKKVIAIDMNPVQFAAVELRNAVYTHLSQEKSFIVSFHLISMRMLKNIGILLIFLKWVMGMLGNLKNILLLLKIK